MSFKHASLPPSLSLSPSLSYTPHPSILTVPVIISGKSVFTDKDYTNVILMPVPLQDTAFLPFLWKFQGAEISQCHALVCAVEHLVGLFVLEIHALQA
jgi:hypothetical protein